jgi:hypothetical protein
VEQWLRSNLSGELNLLVRDLDREAEGSAAQVGQAPAGVVDALIELIRERKIVAVEEAAAELGIEAVEARRCADQAADIVASVGRPAQVLFERRGA